MALLCLACAVPLQSACLPPPAGLAGYWSGDGHTYDGVSGLAATLRNGATFAAGKSGQAFSLGAGNRYVEAPDSPAWAFGSSEFTIDLWANFNGVGGSQTFVASDTGGGTQNKWIFWVNGGVLQFHINGTPGSVLIGSASFSPVVGRWYHVALTRSLATYTFFVDGTAVSTNTDSRIVPDANAPLTIGQAEGQFYFNGLLDEVSIYNRALSASEISALWSADSAGKCRLACPQRVLFAGNVTEVAGREATVPIALRGQGDENALAFSLNFDPALLTYRGEVSPLGGVSLLVNSNQAASGRVGYALAQLPGQRFSAGSNQVLRVRFQLAAIVTNTAITFADAPVLRETVDDTGTPLCTDYSTGLVAITPLFLPVVVSNPPSLTVYAGTNVTLSIIATGSPPLFYQWRLEGSPLAGATTTSLTLTNVATNQSGNYTVVVTNSGGSVTSAPALLTVLPALVAPSIVAQPQSMIVSTGETVAFAVAVAGTPPFRYQWCLNGNPAALPGRTNATLILTNVTTGQAGNYSVAITNDAGYTISADASLTVSTTPRFVRAQNVSVATGSEIEVPVELNALGDENSVGFSLTFDPTRLAFRGAQLGSNLTSVSLLLNTNNAAAGQVGVALTRLAGDRFTAGLLQLLRVRVRAANFVEPVTFGFGDAPILREVVDVFGNARPAFFSNGVVNVLSTGPAVTQPPADQRVPIFGTATFNVTVSGSVPLYYQWQFNETNLPGATASNLVLANVRPSQTGPYRVIVTNAAGATTSIVASLTVPRVIRALSATGATGNDIDVPLQLLAHGDENAAGFSLSYDPARMTFREVRSNSSPANATVNVNTNSAAAGSVGLALAMQTGTNFNAGTQQLALARFTLSPTPGVSSVAFTDAPILRDLVNGAAESLLVDYVGASVTSLLVRPFFTTLPNGTNVPAGGDVWLIAAATGSLPMSWQWQMNGTNLPARTNSTLFLSHVGTAAGGAYSVIASNAAGATNSTIAIVTVQPPPADLAASGLVAPAQVTAGQPVTVIWAVTNTGTSTAVGPWQDTVYLADNPDGSSRRAIGTFTFSGSIGAGQGVWRTNSVIVPSDASGQKYFAVVVDSGNWLPEMDEANNLVVAASSAQVLNADLVVSQITVPPTAQLGQSITCAWSVLNAGNAPASGNWSDRLYFSATSNSLSGATPLRIDARPVALAPGASYTNVQPVTLPLAGVNPGSYFIIAAADYANAQSESDEGNNLRSAPITLTLPPLPDLAVASVSAPANAQPGQPIEIIWTITNRGAATAAGGWYETIYTTNAASGLQSLTMLLFTNPIPAGGFTVRTQAVSLAFNGAAGTLWFALGTDSRNDVVEQSETNNLGTATNSTAIPLVLTFQVAVTQIAEDAANPNIRCTVTRNGDRSQALSVTVSNRDATELSAPASVTISAGQSSTVFDATVVHDGIVDGAQTATLAVSAAGFQGASQAITILDADFPHLFLALATNQVLEGFTVAATVTRDYVTASPLTVLLESSNPNQLMVPASVIIPANSNSVTFSVLAVDDSLLEAAAFYSIGASAPAFTSSQASLTILDNDLPTVTLALAQHTISENAGPQATAGTVTRSPVTTRAVVVELATSDPASALVPATVTIPANQPSASFQVSAVDNAQVDGPRNVTVGGYVLASGSGTRIAEVSPDTLTVTDDDGPALRFVIAGKLVREGLTPATTGTVTRNTPPTNALIVALVSSDTSEATVPPTVTIPSGQASAPFNINTVSDGVSDGNQPVTITASTAGFASAADTMTVSDSDLPDLHVPTVTVPASAQTEAYVTVSYRVANQGFAPTPTNFTTRIYLSSDPVVGSDTLVGQYKFNGTLPVGQYFEQALQAKMPVQAGNYWIIVQTDAEGTFDETLEDNNTGISPTPISVAAAYSAWVQTSITTALAGTLVPMNGRATNSLGAGVGYKLVNIHVVTRGTDRTISALSDANGYFSATFQPLANEAGSYQIFATHPGVVTGAVQDSFSLMGMRVNPITLNVRVVEGSSASGSVSVQNLSDVPLNALFATITNQPAELGVSISLAASSIPGDSSVNLNYTFTAATANGSGVVAVNLTTAEGPTAGAWFVVDIEPLRPRLTAQPSDLVAGMTRGKQVTLDFDVFNAGSLVTGPITLSLPAASWLQLASTNPMPSLAPGASNRVTILLTPALDLPLGPYSGSLALNCSGASLTVPFNFRCMSDSKCDLLVEAMDEFTYYAEGAPRVANANVTVRDAVSRVVVTNGVTGTNGLFFAAQLLEGYYEVEVTAEKHYDYRATRFFVAGQTNEIQAFISRQTVQYIWKVEPIVIEDRYRITIETVFETFVPAPVVTMTPAYIDMAEIVGDEVQINLTLENHGLINADHVTLTVPTHPLWEFTPLLTDIGTLGARTALTIPMTIRRLTPAPAPLERLKASAKSSSAKCSETVVAGYDYVCGVPIPRYITTTLAHLADDCKPTSVPGIPYIFTPPSGGGTPGGGGSPGGGGGAGPGIGNPNIVVTFPNCEECLAKLGKAILDCIISFVPGGDIYKCIYSVVSFIHSPGGLSGVGTVVGCLKAAGAEIPGLGTILDVLGCIDGIISACEPTTSSGGGPPSPGGLGGPKPGSSGGSFRMKNGSAGILELRVPAELGRKYPVLITLARRGDRLATVMNVYRAVFQDDDIVQYARGTNFYNWMSAFDDRINTNSVGGLRLNSAEIAELLALPVPDGLSVTNMENLIARWNRTADYYDAGIYNQANVPAGWSTDFIARDVFIDTLEAMEAAHQASLAEGFDDLFLAVEAAQADVRATFLTNSAGGGVCAEVKLRLDQEAVISRDAFKATLEVVNNSGTQIREVSVEVKVVNTNGVFSTNLFGVMPPTLVNLTAVDGTGLIEPNSTGQSSWVLVPTQDAAPDGPTVYYVSGTLRYTQEGLPVTVPLVAVPITVYPNPRLFLKYFHQRDVYSDDPFTDPIEPSIPFSLAIMVENRGKGVARSMHITSSQPQIIENEKGLLIDFQIIAAEVAGQNIVPSLTVDFGAITNGEIKMGRWLFTSSLQGLFTDYTATFEHIDGLGNPRLSLIEELTIHEMIRLVQAAGPFEDGKPDFLVNDIGDPRDMPDTLYLSDGTTNSVSLTETANTDAPPSPSHLTVQLTAPMQPGWCYLRVPEPANGSLVLTQVVRGDGLVIPFNTNVWTTDRTFLGLGRRPVNENILHLLDYNSAGTYTLRYTVPPAPDTNAPVSAVAVLPANSPMAFPVQWSGSDVGDSGVAFYDVFVSANGGAFTPWLQRTRLNGATYQGQFGVQYAFYCAATDNAGNQEPAHGTPDAVTTITLSNQPPSFAAIGPQTLDEGQTLQLTLSATDPDGLASSLRYTLGGDAPPGVFLSSSGQLTWPTGEGNGPTTNTFTVIVTDNGIPPASDARQLTVIVREVNSAPLLSAVANYTINEGVQLSITNRAQDFDLPANTLRFSLGGGAPPGTSLDATNGIFRWRPTETQGPSTNVISVIVTDNGLPPLGATQQFTVVVRDTRPDFNLSLGSTNLFTGETNSVPIVLDSGLDITNLSFVLDAPASHLTELVLRSTTSEVLGSVLEPAPGNTNRSQVQFVLDAGQLQAGARPLARLGFLAVPGQHSRIMNLQPSALVGVRANGVLVSNGGISPGLIVVVGREPILLPLRAPDFAIRLFGHPGTNYVVQWQTNLLAARPWNRFTSLQLADPSVLLTGMATNGPRVFYRAYEVGANGPGLLVQPNSGSLLSLILQGTPGTRYVIETGTDIGNITNWLPVFDFTLTNSTRALDWTNTGEPKRFFRAGER